MLKRLVKKRLRPRLLAAYSLAAILLWSARPTGWSLAGGLAIVLLGEGLRLWATGYLHKTESLTVAGPYAHIRHPLYLGTLLIGSGLAVMAQSPVGFWIWGLFVLGYFAYYMPYKNRIEGARLEELFGDDFRRYAVAVPRLVPRLYPYVPLGGSPAGASQWTGVRFEDNNETRVALAVLMGVLAVILRWVVL